MKYVYVTYIVGADLDPYHTLKFYQRGLESVGSDTSVSEFLGNPYEGVDSKWRKFDSELPVGHLFSVFHQAHGGPDEEKILEFWICRTVADADQRIAAKAKGYVEGSFEIVAHTSDQIKTHRLMDWWNDSQDHSIAFARHCAKYIDVRGIKRLPPLRPVAQQTALFV